MNVTAILALAALAVVGTTTAQQVGTMTKEVHPSMSSKVCTKKGSCKKESTKIVMDANWRWLHDAKADSVTNCYSGNKFDAKLCPDNKSCAKNCAVEGANYEGTYGVKASGDSLSLTLVTKDEYGTNTGSRVYLMADDKKYRMFNLLNKEFTIDVDISQIPCGLNAALYFVEMEEDGGMKKYPNNKAGAAYGTGYCDAQCPRDLKMINGEGNVEGWGAAKDDANSGTGKAGACCAEMDIWEANKISTAYTPHPCSVAGSTRCKGTECGVGDDRYKGVCDKDGCDYNPYRLGQKSFYGPGSKFKVDTKKKFTVVTQFITTDGTDKGTLKEIRRVYVQGGKVIKNPQMKVKGIPTKTSLTDSVCATMKDVFGNENHFKTLGGMKQMGKAFSKNGMVLTMSLWADADAHCLWLDGVFPVDADPKKPGVKRGTCGADTGVPSEVAENYPDATITFSNIRTGPIDSTY